MNTAIIVVLGSQVLFLVSDLLGRYYMSKLGFQFSSFITWWFAGYQFVRLFATLGQLYVFSQLELGKTQVLFSVAGLVMANVAGYLVLGEVLSVKTYIGIALAIAAFLIISISK